MCLTACGVIDGLIAWTTTAAAALYIEPFVTLINCVAVLFAVCRRVVAGVCRRSDGKRPCHCLQCLGLSVCLSLSLSV